MSKKFEFLGLFITYSGIILGTMVYSGSWIERSTLYDRFIINYEATTLPVSDYEQALKFYTNVMDFRPLRRHKQKDGEIIGFLLPEKKKLVFELVPPTVIGQARKVTTDHKAGHSVTITIRVKNGLRDLQEQILQKTKKPPGQLRLEHYPSDFSSQENGTVTNIIEYDRGSEFVVRDLDGNSFIYYQPKKSYWSRY